MVVEMMKIGSYCWVAKRGKKNELALEMWSNFEDLVVCRDVCGCIFWLLGRSTTGGYGDSRSLMFGYDAHGSYSSSRHGMSYGAGSYRRSDGVNIYSSSYGGHYLPRGGDACW
ncbi:hypothetical protein Hanom_Chr05g00425681 [Helianthus anomalus]